MAWVKQRKAKQGSAPKTAAPQPTKVPAEGKPAKAQPAPKPGKKPEKPLTAKAPKAPAAAKAKAAPAPAAKPQGNRAPQHFTLRIPVAKAVAVISAPDAETAVTKLRGLCGTGFDVTPSDLGLSESESFAFDFKPESIGIWLTDAERKNADRFKMGGEDIFRLANGLYFRSASASEEAHLFSENEKGILWRGRVLKDHDGELTAEWKKYQK